MGLLWLMTASCRQDEPDRPAHVNPSLGTLPTTSTTINPYVIPLVLDAEYFNGILAGLDAASGDLLRLVYRERSLPRDLVPRLEAIYSFSSAIQLEIRLLQEAIISGFDNFRPQIGNVRTSVRRLITVKRACMFAEVVRDHSAQGIDTLTDQVLWVSLVPATSDQVASTYNPTPWAYIYEGFTPERKAPADPCAVRQP